LIENSVSYDWFDLETISLSFKGLESSLIFCLARYFFDLKMNALFNSSMVINTDCDLWNSIFIINSFIKKANMRYLGSKACFVAINEIIFVNCYKMFPNYFI